jgi:hypothetical protein
MGIEEIGAYLALMVVIVSILIIGLAFRDMIEKARDERERDKRLKCERGIR